MPITLLHATIDLHPVAQVHHRGVIRAIEEVLHHTGDRSEVLGRDEDVAVRGEDVLGTRVERLPKEYHMQMNELKQRIDRVEECADDAKRAYNEGLVKHYERCRDFIILHYHANQRSDAPMWAACRDMAVPDSLKHRIDLFRETGRIFREGQELFHEVGWLQVMMGQNIEPTRYDHMADAHPDAGLETFLSDLKTIMAAAVNRLPTHSQFLAQHCAAPAEAA